MLDRLAEGECLLKKGHKIGHPDHLFTRIDDETIKSQIDKLEATIKDEPAANMNVSGPVKKADIKPEITYEDFAKMDIRTATIIAPFILRVVRLASKLTLDLGFEQRTVVSGIAEHYQPEAVIGKKVSLLANLTTRKMKGVESQGMILMAENGNGKLSFISPDENWQNGQSVK